MLNNFVTCLYYFSDYFLLCNLPCYLPCTLAPAFLPSFSHTNAITVTTRTIILKCIVSNTH